MPNHHGKFTYIIAIKKSFALMGDCKLLCARCPSLVFVMTVRGNVLLFRYILLL